MAVSRLIAAATLILSMASPIAAQTSYMRLNIGSVRPTMDSTLRRQAAACVGDTCLVAFGAMRDSARAVAYPTIRWVRSIGSTDDGTMGMLPPEARPTGPLAVAPRDGGFLLVWSEARAVMAIEIDAQGQASGAPWTVVGESFEELRVFEGSASHLLIAGGTSAPSVAIRIRERSATALDTLDARAVSVWRVHGLDDVVALPGAETAELRSIDAFERVGAVANDRLDGLVSIEQGGAAWIADATTLRFYPRYDAASPSRTISLDSIATPFAGALWVTRPGGRLAVSYATTSGRLLAHVAHRFVLDDGTLGPEIVDDTVYLGYDIPLDANYSLAEVSVRRLGVRMPVLRARYTFGGTSGGHPFSGWFYVSVTVEPDGTPHIVRTWGPWLTVDRHWAPVDDRGGLPIRLMRHSEPGREQLAAVLVAQRRERMIESPVAIARVATAQRAPAIIVGERGYVVSWIEEAPEAARAVATAPWDGRTDTVGAVTTIAAMLIDNSPRYRRERTVDHWRYPGVSFAPWIITEYNHPERQSLPAWDRADWGMLRATPAASWSGTTVGALQTVPFGGRPAVPAGHRYFHNSAYDPLREEVVVLAASGLDSLVVGAIGRDTGWVWRRALEVRPQTAIVPIDSGRVLLLFNNALYRVSAEGIEPVEQRLVYPVAIDDYVWRQLEPAFVHLHGEPDRVVLRRYWLDGVALDSATLRYGVAPSGMMAAQRRRDSAMAIVWTDSGRVHLSLLDRRLGVMIEDSILAVSDGESVNPYAMFLGDDLLVAWEDRHAGGPDIAVLRVGVAVPASSAADGASSRRSALSLRVRSSLVRDGRLELDLRAVGEATVELVDAVGRRVMSRQVEPNDGEAWTTLDVATLPTGVYLVRAVSAGESAVERVVVAR